MLMAEPPLVIYPETTAPGWHCCRTRAILLYAEIKASKALIYAQIGLVEFLDI